MSVPDSNTPLAPIDAHQNERIVWCERLLYLVVLLQFPQLANLLRLPESGQNFVQEQLIFYRFSVRSVLVFGGAWLQ